MVHKVKVINELFNEKFQQELRKMAEDKADELMNENPEEYGGHWDTNPYDVEPQLASGSACWEFPDWGEDKAYEEATDYVVNGFFDHNYDLPEVIEEFLECYDNKDREWLEAILYHII